jgi:HlyD family secretion protein
MQGFDSNSLSVQCTDAQSSIRVLLVDDQLTIQKSLQVLLELVIDVEVVGTADNGAAAIAQVKSLHPDIAIVDIEMPGMDGLTTTRLILEAYSTCRVLILSSYDNEAYLNKALQAGATGYLLKDTPAPELANAIRAIHKGHLQVGPSLINKLRLAAPNSSVHHLTEDRISPTQSTPVSSNPPTVRQSTKLKTSSPWLIGIGIFGLVSSILSAAYWYLQHQPSNPTSSLQTVAVRTQDLTVELRANGIVQPIRKINLSPKEAGQIAQLYVDEGDRIQPGQLIARMDSQQIQAQVNQYKAALAKAEADLAQKRVGSRWEEIAEAESRVSTAEASVAAAQAKQNRASEELTRNQLLATEGAISQNTLGDFLSKKQEANANLNAERARLQEQRRTLTKLRNGSRPEEIAQSQAEVIQAKAQLQFYTTQLGNTEIRAPFAGVITRRFAQAGDFVTPTTSASTSDGATSTSIVELAKGLEVEAKVPEAIIARIQLGQSVDIRSDTYSNATFKGNVRLLAPRAVQDQQSSSSGTGSGVTTFRVKVSLTTGQEQLKSGMNVKLKFLGNKIPQALVIPLAAVVTQPTGQTGVWVQDAKQQPQLRPVSLGSVSGDQVQVLKGISQGQQILLSPPVDQMIPGVDTMGF